jgi:hypothetical protein
LSSASAARKSAHTFRVIYSIRSQVGGATDLVPVFGDENQAGLQGEDTLPACADVTVFDHEFEYAFQHAAPV